MRNNSGYQSNNWQTLAPKSIGGNHQPYKFCYNDKYPSDKYLYIYSKLTKEWFVKRYLTYKVCKAALWEIKDTSSEWKKVHSKKKIKALSNITISNKRDKKDI